MSKKFLGAEISTKKLTTMALLISLNVILVRFIGFDVNPSLRIDFGYLSNVMAGMLLGPVLGGMTAAISDLLGVILKGQIGTYFPAFTLNAILYGVLYGAFLYKKEKTWLRISICVSVTLLIVGIVLFPVWSYMFVMLILKKPAFYFTILASSIIKNLIFLPIQIVTIKLISDHLLPNIKGLGDE